jgi:NAD(P)-dependent dehydrogenase (short-subunit alcohol dehydrogenase family)
MHKYAITEAPSVPGRHPAHPGVAARTQSIPNGRYGYPAEYADVIAFLASESASYLTGHPCDGLEGVHS